MDLTNKNVVYVGGCGGIGEAICRHLVQKKISNLAVLDVVEKPELIKAMKACNPSTNVFFVKLDISNKEKVVKCFDDLFAKLKHIDILFNGSGLCNEFKPEITVGVNLLGVMFCTMAFMEKSKGKKGGMVVNIASTGGLEPYPPTPIYSATKAGLVSYSRALADELNFNRHGISFICICPGMTPTGLIDQFTSDDLTPNSAAIKKNFVETTAQTCDQLAENVIEAVEENKNGTVYLCRYGKRSEVSFPGAEQFSVFQKPE
ncbi:alcohol dehydrogenase 2-like [Episyrphus balteatus]|uniref:alcohol dehydrogenase 2-like n=1 Tax=Episyrphus balteatus TaxID=286459 RepID=UPI0024854A68|nr:alcohol dehydrogenase 2-like [Episyrphus balteatus]